jgi:hypothetical protein
MDSICIMYGRDEEDIYIPLYRSWRPLGLREVEAPTFSDIWHTDGGKVNNGILI